MYSAISATKAHEEEKKRDFRGRDWKRVIKTEDERLRIFMSCHSSVEGVSFIYTGNIIQNCH